MNFGRELQDFITGFNAGWGMGNKREEREWERERRRMAQEDHTYRRERDAINDSWRQQQHEYRQGRDNISDQQWSLNYDRWIREQAAAAGKTVEDFLDSDDGSAVQRFYEYYERSNPGVIDDGTASQFMGSVSNSGSGSPYTQVASLGGGNYGGNYGGNVETRHASLIDNESGGNWGAQNSAVGSGGHVGHFGRLQFGQARLEDAKRAGVIPAGMTPQQFMNSPDVQRAVENWHFADIDRRAQQAGLDRYYGQVVGGVRISPDAIRAMAHLGGFNGAKKFIETGGRYNPADVNGTRLSDYGSRHGGQRAAYMARGGLVIPDDEDEQITAQPRISQSAPAQPAPTRTAQAQTAVPEEGMPAPQYPGTMSGQQEAPTDDPVEIARRAVRDGLKWAQEVNDIAISNAAIDTPEMQRGREAYARGYGASQQQLVRQAQDLIDPNHEMPRSERNLRAISTVYEFYLDQGDFEAAGAAAGQLLQAYRIKKNQFASMSRVAAENGDIEGAIQAAVAAYDFIPNNRDLTVEPLEDGTFNVKIVDNAHGEVVVDRTLGQDEFMAAARDFSLGDFDNEILAAVGAPGPQFGGSTQSDGRANEMGVQEAAMEQLEEYGFTPAQAGYIQDVATQIAGTEQPNGSALTPAAAMRFVVGLFAFDGNDPSNQEPNFEVRDIPRNSTHKLIIANGRQVVVPVDAATVLQNTRSEMAAGRQAEFERERDAAESRQKAVDLGINAAQEFTRMVWGEDGPVSIDQGSFLGGPGIEERTEQRIQELDQDPNAVRALPEDASAEDQVQRLLELREQILANQGLRERNPEQYDTLLQRTEDQLRALGYNVDQQPNPPR